LWALKKKARREANESTDIPASIAACTYAIPLASVNAISCAAVEPASRMWYPEMLIVFHFGTRSLQKAKMSVMIRMDGAGG
jgi:hypothetical protein